MISMTRIYVLHDSFTVLLRFLRFNSEGAARVRVFILSTTNVIPEKNNYCFELRVKRLKSLLLLVDVDDLIYSTSLG